MPQSLLANQKQLPVPAGKTLAVLGLLGGCLLGPAGCAGTVAVPHPTPPSPVTELAPEATETRILQLRYRRPYVNGRRGHDFALLTFLEQSLSDDGTLEYRDGDNSVIVTDRPANLHAIQTVIDLLDFSGLPLPPDVGHVPFRVEEGAHLVPNLPPR